MTTTTMGRRSTAEQGSAGTILLIAAAVAFVAGIAGSWQLWTVGHAAFNTGTDMMWGLPVVSYAYLTLTSFGAALVACLALTFRIEAFAPVAARALMLALAMLIAALVALALELGDPILTLWAIPANMAFASPLLWMGVCWAIFGLSALVLLFQLTLAVDDHPRVSRIAAVGLLVGAVAGVVTQGLVYGVMSMRPVWYGPATPLYFLFSTVVIGFAVVTLFTNLAYGLNHVRMPERLRMLCEGLLPKALLAALVVYLIGFGSRVATGLYSGQDGVQIVYRHMVASWPFHLELWVGLLLPLVLLSIAALRHRAGIQTLAAALILGGLFIGRYEFIIGGQLVPLFKGSWVPGFVDYAPSFTEWALLLLAVSLGVLIYALGEKLLNLSHSPKTM